MGFRHQWARFLRGPRTLAPTPGVREAWHRGRRWYHVWVLELDEVAAARRDEVYRALIEGGAGAEGAGAGAEGAGADSPLLLPFSVRTPHVTVWVHGFEEEEAEGPRRRPTPRHPEEGARLRLGLGGASSFLSCPFVEVRAPWIGRLRAGFPGGEERWAAYLPHLTVARYAAAHPTVAVAARLRPLRRLPRLEVEATLRHRVVDAWAEDGTLRDPPDGGG